LSKLSRSQWHPRTWPWTESMAPHAGWHCGDDPTDAAAKLRVIGPWWCPPDFDTLARMGRKVWRRPPSLPSMLCLAANWAGVAGDSIRLGSPERLLFAAGIER
jgi:hypothetical protein